MSTKLFKIC